jgi:MFS transporter, NNP family, nitrate/nitrite transporter
LVKKRVSGQVAGLAGAFGNVGAVTFLTVGLYVNERTFFLVIAGAAVVAVVANLFLVEPPNGFSDELLVDLSDEIPDDVAAGVPAAAPAGESVVDPVPVGR